MRDDGHFSDMETVPWQAKPMCMTKKIASDMFHYKTYKEVKSMKKRLGNFLCALVTHQQAKGLTRLFILQFTYTGRKRLLFLGCTPRRM